MNEMKKNEIYAKIVAKTKFVYVYNVNFDVAKHRVHDSIQNAQYSEHI